MSLTNFSGLLNVESVSHESQVRLEESDDVSSGDFDLVSWVEEEFDPSILENEMISKNEFSLIKSKL